MQVRGEAAADVVAAEEHDRTCDKKLQKVTNDDMLSVTHIVSKTKRAALDAKGTAQAHADRSASPTHPVPCLIPSMIMFRKVVTLMLTCSVLAEAKAAQDPRTIVSKVCRRDAHTCAVGGRSRSAPE